MPAAKGRRCEGDSQQQDEDSEDDRDDDEPMTQADEKEAEEAAPDAALIDAENEEAARVCDDEIEGVYEDAEEAGQLQDNNDNEETMRQTLALEDL